MVNVNKKKLLSMIVIISLLNICYGYFGALIATKNRSDSSFFSYICSDNPLTSFGGRQYMKSINNEKNISNSIDFLCTFQSMMPSRN